MLRSLVRALLRPLISLAVIVLLLEEWLWYHLKAAVQQLVDQPWVHRLESYLRALPPWASLLVLVAPGVVIIPFKVAGLWALAQGYAVLGIASSWLQSWPAQPWRPTCLTWCATAPGACPGSNASMSRSNGCCAERMPGCSHGRCTCRRAPGARPCASGCAAV